MMPMPTTPAINPRRFAGKTAIVTGAGRGMGRVIATQLAAEGAGVMLVSRAPEPLAAALADIQTAGGTGFTHACDLADPSTYAGIVDGAIAAWGRVDVLINNAGISGAEAPFLTMTPAAWHQMRAITLDAPFFLSQRVARAMTANGKGGVIVNNASIAGLATDGPYAHYSACKAGLIALTRSMAVELAPHGIRVNAVSPGYTATEMTTGVVSAAQQTYMTQNFERVPMRRLVTPEEVARAFLFLASDEASGITGSNLVVDGGLTANLFILETLPKA
jgi:NAD(P)-dependent dehydrogenase (short-subunit alcohol dehydrogenase family)